MLLWCSNQDEPTNRRRKGSRLIRPLFDQKLWLKWLSRLAQLASSWRKRKTYYLVGPLKGNDMRSFLLANVSPTLVMLLVSVSNNILPKTSNVTKVSGLQEEHLFLPNCGACAPIPLNFAWPLLVLTVFLILFFFWRQLVTWRGFQDQIL